MRVTENMKIRNMKNGPCFVPYSVAYPHEFSKKICRNIYEQNNLAIPSYYLML